MDLFVKYSRTCCEKKQSANAYLTPPDSSLSSSSGSLSSITCERKRYPKKKPIRYKGHTTLIAIPNRKKSKTKKPSYMVASSGSDSDWLLQRNIISPNKTSEISIFSQCKSFCCLFVFKWPRDERPCECQIPAEQSRFKQMQWLNTIGFHLKNNLVSYLNI